jgi:hypothetical protein
MMSRFAGQVRSTTIVASLVVFESDIEIALVPLLLMVTSCARSVPRKARATLFACSVTCAVAAPSPRMR